MKFNTQQVRLTKILFTVSQNWLFFGFKSSKFDTAGELTALPRFLAMRKRGEEARLAPTFQTSRFFRLLSLPPQFVASPYIKLSSVVIT